MRRHLVTLALLTLLAGSGCGGESPSAEPQASGAPATTTTQAAPQTTQPTGPAEPYALPYVATIVLAKGNYKALGVIHQGDLKRAQPGMTNGRTTLGTGCSVDSRFDAVIPFRIELTNKTAGFAVKLGFTWQHSRAGDMFDPLNSRVRIYSSHAVGGQPRCVDEHSSNNLTLGSIKSTNALETERTLAVDGFIILEKFYNPNFPNGDFESLTHVAFGIRTAMADDTPLLGSNPTGGMQELRNDPGRQSVHGVSLIPSLAKKNCLVNTSITCAQ